MNAILYALNQIRHKIPTEILELAFTMPRSVRPTVQWQNPQTFKSLDHLIKDKVIYGRVNIDCNLKGATEIGILLDDVSCEQYDAATRVFRIPRDKTLGRDIVSIRTLNYITYSGISGYTGQGGDQLMNAFKDMFAAISQMPVVATADCQLIGENIVMVRDTVAQSTPSLGLTCLVANDKDMNNLNPGAYRVYSDLVVLATKAYIHTVLDISIDQGQLHAGMTLGRIREIVDGYSDANELYDELFRERWGKTAFTNDRPRMNNFIKSMVGRGF